jgi:hypothetical protein
LHNKEATEWQYGRHSGRKYLKLYIC